MAEQEGCLIHGPHVEEEHLETCPLGKCGDSQCIDGNAPQVEGSFVVVSNVGFGGFLSNFKFPFANRKG